MDKIVITRNTFEAWDESRLCNDLGILHAFPDIAWILSDNFFFFSTDTANRYESTSNNRKSYG